jgi:nicotinamidase/pyrazinamidase
MEAAGQSGCLFLWCSRVFCAGLATGFCVAWTAMDAKAAGFETYPIEDASRAIDSDGSLARAKKDLGVAGFRMIGSVQIREP